MKLKVMTWNVENFFPVGVGAGPKTQPEYDAKLQTLASVIARPGPGRPRPTRGRRREPRRPAPAEGSGRGAGRQVPVRGVEAPRSARHPRRAAGPQDAGRLLPRRDREAADRGAAADPRHRGAHADQHGARRRARARAGRGEDRSRHHRPPEVEAAVVPRRQVHDQRRRAAAAGRRRRADPPGGGGGRAAEGGRARSFRPPAQTKRRS